MYMQCEQDFGEVGITPYPSSLEPRGIDAQDLVSINLRQIPNLSAHAEALPHSFEEVERSERRARADSEKRERA